MKFWLLFFYGFFLMACSSSGLDIPKFSVKPISAVGKISKSTNSKSTNSKLTNSKLTNTKLKLQKIGSSISCSAELKNLNLTKLLAGTDNTPADWLAAFYSQAIFYDCNARQQVIEDAKVIKQKNADVESKSEPVQLYTAKRIIDDDKKRFVSWTKDPSSSDVQGKLVNVYTQDDDQKSKTRVDLKKIDGAKTIKSFVYIFSPQLEPTITLYTKSYFKEIKNASKKIVEHHVAGRHYNTQESTIINVIASIKLNKGASVFVHKCTNISNNQHNIACSGNTPTETKYYDKNKNTITLEQANALGLTTNYNFLAGKLTPLANFYSGNFDEQFKATFTPE